MLLRIPAVLAVLLLAAPAAYCEWTVIELNEPFNFGVCIVPIPEPTQIRWYTRVRANSGFHNHHNSDRDQYLSGSVSPDSAWPDDWGCAWSTFFPPGYVAGEHAIVTVWNGYEVESPYINVKALPPFQELPSSPYYQKVGATGDHPDSHWGTPSATAKIQQICEAFYNETGLRPGVNDMSLPWGGIFDLGPTYNGSWWAPPHGAHTAGLNADMPFQYLGTPAQRARFVQIAQDLEASVYPESNHYHLTL